MMIVMLTGIIEGQVYVYCISSVPLFVVLLEYLEAVESACGQYN